MKYMGSKRWQLTNGLGQQLRRVVNPGDRFVDLFAGSGVVSWFAATELGAAVTAVDLQHYSAALSGSVVTRTRRVDTSRLVKEWLRPACERLDTSPPDGVSEERPRLQAGLQREDVFYLRKVADESDDVFVRSYAGHYYSFEQAFTLGSLRSTLPAREPDRVVCLAALIMAASRCSASPGHTAQPFQPSMKALPHIQSIWRRSMASAVELALREICGQHAVLRGRSVVADANEYAQRLTGREVVFIDPPYSAAQYSRFYHVLEAVATGGYDKISGAGRAPDLAMRASSDYSMVSTARAAIAALLERLGDVGCRVVATFPQYRASNGLSGFDIADEARRWFDVDTAISSATFSTLGGNGSGSGRSARQHSHELVITMYPRKNLATSV